MTGPEPSAPTHGRRASLDAITGLRFLAASHVVFYHYAVLPQGTPAGLVHAVGHGYVGVSFFYLLSGFILTYNYAEGDPGHRRMRGTARAFWTNRFSRVFPLYFAAWLLSAPFVVAARLGTDGLTMLSAAKLAGAALVSLGLVQAWIPGGTAWWNPPGWSISVEALFYAVFPWLMPRLLSLRASRVALALGLYGSALAAPVLLVVLGGGAGALDLVKFEPLLHLPTFALGMLTAELHAARARDLARWSGPLAGAALFGLVLVLRRPPDASYPLIHNGLLAPLFAALILAVAAGVPGLSRLLGARPLVLLGEASYGIYILQAPVHLASRAFVGGQVTPGRFALDFALLCALAWLGFRYVEVPAQRWLRGRLGAPWAPSKANA